MRKLLMVLACVVGVLLLLVGLAAAPAAPRATSPAVSAVSSSPAAVRLLTAEEVEAALLVADDLEPRFTAGRLYRHWFMPVKAEGVPICNDWAVEVGGQIKEQFFAGARSASPTRFAGVGRGTWVTKKDHHYVAGVIFGSSEEAAAAWEKIGAAVAACPRKRRERALLDGTKLTSERNSPIDTMQTWSPEAETWWGGWRWLRVRELANAQRVLSGRDSAQRGVHDYALIHNVIVVQLRREWGRPDASWRALDGRTRDAFGLVLRRLDATPCGPEGCVAP